MDDLTRRLSDGPHPVTVGGPQPSLEDLRQRVEEIGYVFIKFTGTEGGTDLGVRLDRSASSGFGTGSDPIHLEGTLYLNDDPVRCVADIDPATLNGTGRLMVVAESELVG